MRAGISAVLLAFAAPALATELDRRIDKDPVVFIENDAQGRFERATAVVRVMRPAAEVWATMMDFHKYKEFIPRLLKSDARRVNPARVEVDYEVEVPGANSRYTFRYEIDAAKLELRGRWIAGDSKDSAVLWRLAPEGDKTVIHYSSAAKNLFPLADELDDEKQTLAISMNVAAAISISKAMKERAEASGPRLSSARTEKGAP